MLYFINVENKKGYDKVGLLHREMSREYRHRLKAV